jgi:plastocyanin
MWRCAPAIADAWAFLPLAFDAAAVLRPFSLLLAFLALAAVTQSIQAATVSVVVTDAESRPLVDAVVMLEPATGRLTVNPMNGVQIAQTHRQFSPQVSVVTVGTPVTFPNNDTVRHHVYSFSPVKTFELKLYAGVPASPVVFDKPGIAVLGCNIHDQMVAWVVVVDTPLYARSAASGRAQIEGVAPGSYRLRVWHSSLAEGAPPTSTPLVVGNADIEQRSALGTVGRSK